MTDRCPVAKAVFKTVEENLRFTRTNRPVSHIEVVGIA